MPAVTSEAARVARAVRARDPEAEAEARKSLAEAKIAEYVERTLADAPPLSAEQLARLSALLHPGR